MSITKAKLKYNLRLEKLEDIRPETLSDRNGILQSDHNRLNEIARNQLSIIETGSRNNSARISELEKLVIKQQADIDYIKGTPSTFDLSAVELFQNRFGTEIPLMAAEDGVVSARIYPDLFEARSGGNFELGLLKSPRSKPFGEVEETVDLSQLFGADIHGIAYGEKTNSLWIITSEGNGQRGYLFRCSPNFIDQKLNILSYWILKPLGGNLTHFCPAESTFDGVTTLFISVSDETGGAHFIARYLIDYDDKRNIVLLQDGTESSTGVLRKLGNGDTIESEPSTNIAGVAIGKIDISESGKMRGIEVVNNYLYMIIQNQSVVSNNIDSSGYSFIRRVRLSGSDVLITGANSVLYKFDDILETSIDGNNTLTHYDLFGISSHRTTTQLQPLTDVSNANINSMFNQNTNRNLFYLSAQHVTTKQKKLFLVDLTFSDLGATDINYLTGLRNLAVLHNEFRGFNSETTEPYITSLPNRTILEVYSSTTKNILAVHDLTSFDVFQGDVISTHKTKRYFSPTSELYHGQLGVRADAVTINGIVSVFAMPDNNVNVTTAGGNRSRNFSSLDIPAYVSGNGANLLCYNPHYSGIPRFDNPSLTFSINDGTSSPISGITSLSWNAVTSGTTLYVSYINNSNNKALISIPAANITGLTPQLGMDTFTQYPETSGSLVSLTAGNLGSFAGPVSFDPIKQNLWVATTAGFIHNVTDGGSALNFSNGNSFPVLKIYSTTSVSGEVTDGSLITAISIFDNKACIAAKIPNNNNNAPKNTTLRIFDLNRSTSSNPFSTSVFTVAGIVKDISFNDKGLYVVKGESLVEKIADPVYTNNVLEPTEIIDEFNFLKNSATNTTTAGNFGLNVTDTLFFEKVKPSESFRKKEWILPRRGIAVASRSASQFTNTLGKLTILDYSDINNPLLWSEFHFKSNAQPNPILTGTSGSVLHGSGQIDAMTFIDDKLFVGRRDYGIGTVINVIDFANDSATILVDRTHLGSGSLFSGMQFGYKNVETTRTGGLNERNNPSYHYSGFVNPRVKVGPFQINDMSSEMVENKTSQSVLTPYIIVGHDIPNGYTSGGVDIINGQTLESFVQIGPGVGPVKRVKMNPDGSAVVGNLSGTIYKINDVRAVDDDRLSYISDFSASSINVFYPNGVRANKMTDMKVKHFTDTLGNKKNIIYASYFEGSGLPTYAVKFTYEDVAAAGGTTSGEFLNNAEVIYFNATEGNGINSIDFLDERVFLGFNDPSNGFRMAIAKKFDFPVSAGSSYSNNYYTIMGTNGAVDGYIDYNDLNYAGIKSQIASIEAIPNISLLMANTNNGSVIFKFPFVPHSKWFSTVKPLTVDANAVAIARDAFLADGVVTEFINREDTRIQFNGSWSDASSGTIVPYTSPLFDKADGRKQMPGRIVDSNGIPFVITSDYAPFSQAPENGIDFKWNGSGIVSHNFQYTDNVLTVNNDRGIQVFDLVDIAPGNIDFKPVFKNKNIALVSVNDSNTTASFFTTTSGSVDNLNADSFGFKIVGEFDISQNPVISINTLDGRPISTFQDASATGETDIDQSELIKDDLASTEKLIRDPDGNPISTVVLTGNKARLEGKFTKKVTITTVTFKVRERL